LPRSLFVLLVVTFAVVLGLAGCVFDVGVDPATPTDATGGGGSPVDGFGPTADATPGDAAALPDSSAPAVSVPGPGVWPATFTTTLTGDGLTLQPLGTRRGFTGVLSAPDGSLRLEALP